MNANPNLTADQQIAVLADVYSQRAEAYDELWSPVIRPVGERLVDLLELSNAERVIDVGTGAGALLPAIQSASPAAQVIGVDRSAGMLRLARHKFAGPLALMDVQRLGIQSDQFDAAVFAFVLFHMPSPRQCLEEVNRVLKPGGKVGIVTWGPENGPQASVIWDEELAAAGAPAPNLPAVDNKDSCNSVAKMTALLQQTGYVSIKSWSEPLEHRWESKVYFDYQLRSPAQQRLKSLDSNAREACLVRVRERLSRAGDEAYVFTSEVVMTTAVKLPDRGGR